MNRQAYLQLLQSAPWRTVSLGAGGVDLFAAEELDDAQVGYAVSPDGERLTGTGEDDWQAGWLAVGIETTCGDPLFIDLAAPEMPVYTAMHGMGYWEPQPVADSAEAFFRSLELVRAAAAGREHPVALDAHPLPASERDAVLRQIRALSPRSDPSFWESLLNRPV